MRPEEVLQHFRKTGALLEGHFQLSSGLHSSTYLQCALALQEPMDAARFGAAIADKFSGREIETVVAPAIGGLIIGYETARHLEARFIWTERENGAMTLRRGFELHEDERILIVEDVITTGGSTRETITAIATYGANVLAAASIIDRSNGKADVGVPRIALATLNVPSYETNVCPNCERGETAIKPGSRTVQSPKSKSPKSF
ncbi:MAG: orotate phosphoribosyltransferase [Pyrinomonadaceae bacterium]|nr:orotate phosphoribosyltransferase [Pyrinomonadaceae bacterium]